MADTSTQKKASRKRSRAEPEVATKDDLGPYPNHSHPTVDECRAVHDGLVSLHPDVMEQKLAKKAKDEGGCGSRKLVLDALVGTILSQNTTDVNSHRAFCSLKNAFPTWEAVRDAPNADVEEAIKSGGLAKTKVERIKLILNTLQEERGELSLEYMHEMSDNECKTELRRFKGVGAKTISCVLLFCLGRQDFPVDTHVWKIALALNWVPKSADRDGTYAHLNMRVPNEIKYSMHVLLVEHGKQYKNDVAVLKKLAREQCALRQEAEAAYAAGCAAGTSEAASCAKVEVDEPKMKRAAASPKVKHEAAVKQEVA